MSQNDPAISAEARLRRVHYERWGGVWSSWEPTENTLLAFVYDYHTQVGACGIFPPLHLLNQFLLRGGGGGGMGPGARWEPSSVSREEYDLLVEAIRTVPPDSIAGLTGVAPLPFTFDPQFDGPPETYPVRAEVKKWHRYVSPDHREYFAWAGAVCVKHSDRWHGALRRAGKMR
jgi:hypothetical protein